MRDKKSTTEPQRFNLELGPKSSKALQNLQDAMEVKSKAEVVRYALQTMAWFVEETRRGGAVILRRSDGEDIRVILPPTLR